MRRTAARKAAVPAAEVWVVDASGAEAFAGRVFEGSRILPLVLVSTSRVATPSARWSTRHGWSRRQPGWPTSR